MTIKIICEPFNVARRNKIIFKNKIYKMGIFISNILQNYVS